LATKCGQALGKGTEAWLFALDAMVNISENKTVDDAELKSILKKVEAAFEQPRKVKADETRLRDCESIAKNPLSPTRGEGANRHTGS